MYLSASSLSVIAAAYVLVIIAATNPPAMLAVSAVPYFMTWVAIFVGIFQIAGEYSFIYRCLDALNKVFSPVLAAERRLPTLDSSDLAVWFETRNHVVEEVARVAYARAQNVLGTIILVISWFIFLLIVLPFVTNMKALDFSRPFDHSNFDVFEGISILVTVSSATLYGVMPCIGIHNLQKITAVATLHRRNDMSAALHGATLTVSTDPKVMPRLIHADGDHGNEADPEGQPLLAGFDLAKVVAIEDYIQRETTLPNIWGVQITPWVFRLLASYVSSGMLFIVGHNLVGAPSG